MGIITILYYSERDEQEAVKAVHHEAAPAGDRPRPARAAST